MWGRPGARVAHRHAVEPAPEPHDRPRSVSGPAAAAGLAALVVLLAAGDVVRSRVPLLRRWFIPASLVGGAMALLAGPEVTGRLGAPAVWPASVTDVWAALPEILITIVFGALFLGRRIPGPREVWRIAGPQVAVGQALAWSHYAVGLTLALLVLGPLFGLPAVSGTLLEIGLVGGHGTSAGMRPALAEAGLPEGGDLALGLATVGIVAAVLLGVAFVNWSVRTGRVPREMVDPDPAEGAEQERGRRLDPRGLPYALAAIAAACGLGWLILAGLTAAEDALWGQGIEVAGAMPLFPFAMIGGILLQLALGRAGREDAVDRPAANAAGTLALDLLIVAAVGTLSLGAIGSLLGPFLILVGVGLSWTVLLLALLAPRVMPDAWVPRTAAEVGQGLGMVAAGLLLLRVADPADSTPAGRAFGYKQLLFEPVLGGGVFTAASVALVAAFGGWPVLAGVAAITAGWVAAGLALARRRGAPA